MLLGIRDKEKMFSGSCEGEGECQERLPGGGVYGESRRAGRLNRTVHVREKEHPRDRSGRQKPTDGPRGCLALISASRAGMTSQLGSKSTEGKLYKRMQKHSSLLGEQKCQHLVLNST